LHGDPLLSQPVFFEHPRRALRAAQLAIPEFFERPDRGRAC
jgi:hypothetical protein